ncbi:hypothetical protein GH714_027092 [Hevea brasiliensis]|uniref:Uncharacterized protein n=1 Tax=Hevea brasiliensis TaxID=3981 RepID=A0A6A6N2A5_HEVBR|nr:hypothetical protein GH714_027092 [Hevea brasiliensis]
MAEPLEMPMTNDLTMVISQSKETGVVIYFTDPSTVYDNVKQDLPSAGISQIAKNLSQLEQLYNREDLSTGLALESYLDSGHQGVVPAMAPSRVAGGLAQSSSSSGIFFQGDGQSQAVVNSHLTSSFGNSSNSIPGTGRPNLGPVSGDMNNAVLNSVANSGPSVGASSLVTDANSAFSGGPHLQRSASINTESYMRLPASPMSFSSNNISISGSSVVDGSSVVQQGNHQDPSSQQVQQNHQQQQGASSATSLPSSQAAQASLPMAAGSWCLPTGS